MTTDLIRSTTLRMVEARGAGKSICPSEVARCLSKEDWRPLMPEIRQVASVLAEEGRVRITQKGETVDLNTAKGPYRIGKP